MRILKRNLAFVMVLAMALGMMVTASAANVEDYKDANDITFVEAVDVMTALGILEGEDGTFNPQNTLTREQGAKIITYLMLGKDAAENLGTNAAPFNDVAAGRWSAGFVAYCASQGIVGGYGNGNFGPNDTLTATQFAKMLLVALGYGVNGEFTGPNWEIETNKQALVSGLYEGNLGANYTVGVKREEAALYAFNTLTGTMTVKYSDVFGAYYSGNIFGGVDENDPDSVKEKYTLGYTLYNLTHEDGADDDFGRQTKVWKQGTKSLTDAYAKKADLTYTAGVKATKIYKDLGLTATKVEANVTVDGETDTAVDLVKKIDDEKNIPVTGNGALVEVYHSENDSKDVVDIVVINTYLAQVTKYDAKNEKVTVKIEELGGLSVSDKTFETAVEYEEDDYVLVTAAKGKIQTLKLAPVVEGDLEAVASDKSYIRFDGEKVNASKKYHDAGITASDIKNNVYDMITDDYGYVLFLNKSDEKDDGTVGYLFVHQTQYDPEDLKNGGASALAKVEYLDGTGKEVLPLLIADKKVDTSDPDAEKVPCVKVVGTTAVDGTSVADWTVATGVDELEGEFYAYSIDDDGYLVLRLMDSLKNVESASYEKASVATEGKTTGKFGDTSYKLNSKSVVHVVDDDNLKTYTGYKNIDFKVDNANILVITDGTTDLIKEAFVIGEAETESDNIYAFFNGKTEDVSDGLQVELVIDGELNAYVVESGENNLETDVYGKYVKAVYVVTMNSKNEVAIKTLAEVDTADNDITAYADKKVTVAKNQYMEVEGETGEFVYADDVVVYDVTGSEPSEGSVSEDNQVTFIVNKDDQVSVVFITKEDASK